MAKQMFNEAERYLLDNWTQAVQVEESLVEIRDKYKSLVDQVFAAARERYPVLDASGVYATQRWTPGEFGLGRKAWGGKEGWPPGIWFWTMRLEKMFAEEEAAPVAYLWLCDGKKPPLDLAQAARRIKSEAKNVLTSDEYAAANMDDSDPSSLCQLSLAPRSELLTMLRDGDGEAFKDCLLARINTLAKFIPVLDELFLHGRTKVG